MIVLIHIFTQQVTGIQPRRNIYFNEYNLYNKQKGSLKSIKKVFVFILELRLELSSTSRKMTSQNLKKPSSLESNEKRFSNVRKSKGLHNIVFDKCGCLFFFFFCRAAWPWPWKHRVLSTGPPGNSLNGELEMWGLTFSFSPSVAKIYKRTMAVDQCALCVRKEITVKMKSSLALEPTYHTKEIVLLIQFRRCHLKCLIGKMST